MRKLSPWKLGVLVFGIAAACAGIFRIAVPRFGGAPGPDPLMPGAVLQSVPFPDGACLVIHGLGEEAWQDGIMAAPAAGLKVQASGTSRESFGFEKEGLQIGRFTLGDRLAGVRYMAGPGRLVLSVRYLDPTGGAVAQEQMKPGDLVIRLSDGAGGSIKGEGPHGAVEDPWSRGIVSFGGWPRGGKELVFQAVRSGRAPVEFRLPNPAAGATPASWRPLPLPQSQKGDHWDVRLVKVREITTEEKGKVLVADFEFQSDLDKPFKGNSPIDGWPHGVLGSRGTRSEWSIRLQGDNGMQSAFQMPPDEDAFKLIYRIIYRPDFPFPRAAVSIIAEGAVSADGKTILVAPRDGFPGIEKVEVGVVTPARDSWYPGEHEFTVSFEGGLKDAAEKSAAFAKAGVWKDWTPVLILDGDGRTSGGMDMTHTSTSDSTAETRFTWNGRWTGNLKPGIKVEIGVMARKPDEMLEFTIDRASLSPE